MRALGAGRLRLLAPVLAEGGVLAFAGGAAGIAVAFTGTRWFATRGPADVPRLADATIDWRVLLFAAVVSLAVGLLISLIPARRVARRGGAIQLREAGMGLPGRHRARAAFVGVQVALAIILLTGAGLMVRTAIGLATVDPGFRERNALTFRLTLPAARYAVDAVPLFIEQLAARIGALPGVVAVGATGSAPLSGNYSNMTFVRDGEDFRRDGTNPQADYASVTPGYFAALGIPLREGRLYYPHMPVTGSGSVQRSMTFVVATAGSPSTLSLAVSQAVAALDPQLAVQEIRTIEEVLRAAFGRESFVTALLAGFATLALVLGGLGVYGVTASLVAQRTREIGVRIALGATATRVIRLVLRQSMTAVVLGVVAGVAGALALARYLATLLYGVQPQDPVTVLAAVIAFGAVALAAALLPARRATRVDPNITLRAD